MSALQFEALKVALKQDATGYVLTLKIHPDEIPEELLRDFVGARYMVAMARLNDDESPVPYNNRVKQAAMLCKNKVFFDFVSENYGVNVDSEASATHFLYEFCEIQSRTELNGNKNAQKLFDELVGNYENYAREKLPF